MLSIDTNCENEVRILLFDLVVKCPFGGDLEKCPFYKIRKLAIVERLKWVDIMSHTDRVNLLLQHDKCQSEMEKAL